MVLGWQKGELPMRRLQFYFFFIAALLMVVSPGSAQTTQPGNAIDLEIFNPANGSNRFCVPASGTIDARVYLRTGADTLNCTLSCSPPDVPGGSANIATAVIDVAFDGNVLSYVPASMTNNAGSAAVQGLGQQQNLADGRIGWALAGSWNDPGNPGSTLLSPCEMQMINSDDWLFQVQFQAVGNGMTTLRLRRETDTEPFALSFADICGTEAFKESNAGIDEIRNAVVMVAADCQDVIFFDNFGTGDASLWSSVGVQ